MKVTRALADRDFLLLILYRRAISCWNIFGVGAFVGGKNWNARNTSYAIGICGRHIWCYDLVTVNSLLLICGWYLGD